MTINNVDLTKSDYNALYNGIDTYLDLSVKWKIARSNMAKFISVSRGDVFIISGTNIPGWMLLLCVKYLEENGGLVV